ncbi:hypothetical protein L3X38_020963 [Prunus dulcis]|uniref:Large ribosomal subunit protein uL4m n=1 Tax=Prunus dulcis TaxID=3755 RepID=A0AAD4VV23_PRUDU|nr:hypothetical protein L3X38_020963 [Prunus dulcis]
MALSVSRRLLRSFGSVLASGHCDSPSSLYPSLHASHDLCGHVLGDILFCEELSPFSKARSSFLANRRLLTSISTPESSGGWRIVGEHFAEKASGSHTKEHIQQKLLVRLVGLGESHGIRRVLFERGRDHCVVPSSEEVPQCMVLKIALTARAAKGKLLVFDDFELKLATQNLHYVNVLPAVGLNVYSILQHDTLVMSRAAVYEIVERMHTPIKR